MWFCGVEFSVSQWVGGRICLQAEVGLRLAWKSPLRQYRRPVSDAIFQLQAHEGLLGILGKIALHDP